ncbi:MAG: DUF3313 domain-containing protein [Colwellia sp.]|uniref:DUF3313 family protein n=1 Tax=Colwellia sp. TaxID=56799 RepID=UPI0025C13858|nr:DUF3313 family protein [Colwellia sp.]NQZ25539.1 DUF3313 domain-containing protein [Colwellia sp.]
MIKLNKLISHVMICSTLLFVGCSSTETLKAPEISSDGLTLKHISQSTIVYKKSGIDFSNYDKVKILPGTVAFKKNWQRDYNRSASTLSTQIKDKDVVRIKGSVASLLNEVFIEEFSRNDDYPIVDIASEGTLLIKPSIIDLDINAPDITSSRITRTITEESGSATLFLEIYDAVSGEILARIVDTETAENNSHYQWSTRVSNHADAKRIIKKWAKALRSNFDQAHE